MTSFDRRRSDVEDGQDGHASPDPAGSLSDDDEDSEGACHLRPGCIAGFICLTIVIGMSIAVVSYGVTDFLRIMVGWLPKNPGWYWFAAMYVVISLSIVFILPFWPPICMAAGLIFGFGWGWFLDFCAILTAAILSICIGRVFFKEAIRDMVQKNGYESVRRMMLIIEDGDDSMQLLILFRFLWLPMFLRNYTPSVLEVPFWKLSVACIPHCIWVSFLFASIGASFKSSAELLRDKGKFSLKDVRWQDCALFCLSIVMTTILGIYTHRLYTKRLEHEEGLFYEEPSKSREEDKRK